MHYFDTRGEKTLITTFLFDHQEAIQFRAAEKVINCMTMTLVETKLCKEYDRVIDDAIAK